MFNTKLKYTLYENVSIYTYVQDSNNKRNFNSINDYDNDGIHVKERSASNKSAVKRERPKKRKKVLKNVSNI